MKNIVEGRDITYEYLRYEEDGTAATDSQALRGVDLDVASGQFIAVLGHNGSGKSTLARLINALLIPGGGTLFVGGFDTSDEESIPKVRQTAGMVFQNPDNQIIASVVEEDVGFGPENLAVETEEIWRRVEDALKKVGMWERRKSSPNRLSGGQKQRVAIAGVLAMKPACIVLDEPTAMLDPEGRAEVIRTVTELNKEEGVTIILITHYMEEVIGADRVIVMDDGKVVMQGTPREIFSRSDELRAIRMDVPWVTRLSDELRNASLPMPQGVLTLEELTDALEEIRRERKTLGVCEAADKAADGRTHSEDNRARVSAEKPQEPASVETAGITGDGSAADAVKTDAATERDITSGVSDITEAGRNRPGEGTSGKSACKGIEIVLDSVGYEYSAGTSFARTALKDVNLTIRQGEFIGVIGRTGSGKSTLIQHLNALNRPSSGTIRVDGRDIWEEGYPLKELRSRVGLVFQYPEYQLFESDVLKDVCFGPLNQGLTQEQAVEKARRAMHSVGMDESFEERSPYDLSGGQKRRAAIAGILAMEPQVLVLDEPTAGLDPKGRDEILGLLKKLHETQKITVVLVSHSMEDIADYAGRVIVIDEGRIVMDGAPGDIYADEEGIRKAGLDLPQVTKVIKRLNELGWNLDLRETTIEGAAGQILKRLNIC